MLFIHCFIQTLAQILNYIATVLGIAFVISLLLNLMVNVVRASSISRHDSIFVSFSSKLSHVSKLLMFIVAVLLISYMFLIPIAHMIEGDLYTGDLLDYPESEWVSEDGTVLISIGNGSGEYPNFADNGTCRINHGQVTNEYLVVKNYNFGIRLYSDSDELKMKFYIYLLNDDSFYADVRDAKSFESFNRIIKFNRVS